MISLRRFRMLGHAYASIGIFYTCFDVADKILDNVQENSHYLLFYIAPAVSFVMLIFFMILLVGIWMNNLTLLKIHRVFLHVFYGFIIGSLIITLVVVIGLKIFTDETVPGSFIESFVMALATFLGFYLLFLWIIIGIIQGIQFEQQTSDIVVFKPEADDKQEI